MECFGIETNRFVYDILCIVLYSFCGNELILGLYIAER